MTFKEKLNLLKMPKAELASITKMERSTITRWKDKPPFIIHVILDLIIENRKLKAEVEEFRGLGRGFRKLVQEAPIEGKEAE